MRIICSAFILCLFASLSVRAQFYRENILFRYKSPVLTAENLVEIKKIWERLPVNCAVELWLVSEKEMKKISPGDQATLTKARADAIKLFLTTQKMVNIYDIELNTRSFIEEEKIHGTSASFKRKVRNPYKVYSVVLSKEVPICYNYTEAEKKALTSKVPVLFTFSTEQDQMITAPGGTIVLIPAHSFLLPNNKLTADVTIKLWEFLTMDDIALAGLSTTSSGRLLETGGMIYITAEYEGNCLRLLRNSTIKVKFPVSEKADTMRLFKGIPKRDLVDWKKTNNLDTGVPVSEGDSISSGFYVLASSGLGWINCDRFYNVQDKIDVAFTCPANFKGFAGLIFTEINSLMEGNIQEAKNYNNITFTNVPRGMEVVLLLFAISTDKKKVFYATQKLKLGDVPKDEIKFIETTTENFKEVVRRR